LLIDVHLNVRLITDYEPRWCINHGGSLDVKTTVVHKAAERRKKWAMAREDPQLKLRLSEEMKQQIADAAKANGRSVNAEIVARIEMAESLKELLSNFELAKERILAQEAREADLKKQVTRLHGIATSAQDINRQLIAALMQRLGMTEEEITAITKPTKAR
jgi:hypothetical protein